ncbi:transposase IS66 [Alkaliphilus metalliredigens QYMF]|uniref:Transposase IS66 n=1 Tax=Alkaliphilus metalliredigens (strain QYMF) TaxID=293826 RepID=A6TJJ0_ALKMQ|nr:IS66 family transposase [Alkaliphilus metalliredigens]ABR46358.1 transposase IS66 [Alkaliphilus metalliredigens QYMF]
MKTIENSTHSITSTTEDRLAFFENELAQKEQKIEELEAKVKFYEEQFRLSQAQKYGSSSEKTDPDQMSIFNEAEKFSVKLDEEPEAEEVLTKRRTGKSKSKKKYEDLPIEEVHYTLSDEERQCPKCDHTLHEMKTEVRKELKIIPAQVKVVHHIKQVYACRGCDAIDSDNGGTIITAPMPKPVLPGSMVSPSVLAFIMENKYNQALPLYRQEASFVNYGIDLSRQNMASWIIQGAEKWLSPLYDRMHTHLKQSPVIHADESPLKVLDEKDKSQSYMWLYATAETSEYPIYLYEYQPSRAKKHPKQFLEGFTGFLQTDGYAGYNGVENVVQVGCLAHARRKYTDAIKALPEGSDVSLTKANEGLSLLRKIYRLEKSFKEMEPEVRYEARIEQTQPVLDAYKTWLEVEEKRTLPKSKLGQAISYSLKQWDKLAAFMKDGRIAIDNNLAERGIKPFVLGRKNYLFAKSPKGATASALCYSIIETAKANKLIPFQYLTYLFEQLPNLDIEDPEALDAMLPWAESLPNEVRHKTEKND